MRYRACIADISRQLLPVAFAQQELGLGLRASSRRHLNSEKFNCCRPCAANQVRQLYMQTLLPPSRDDASHVGVPAQGWGAGCCIPYTQHCFGVAYDNKGIRYPNTLLALKKSTALVCPSAPSGTDAIVSFSESL